MTECRTVEDLAESIANADGECVFLIGAGFSRSAGIPLASELVSEIKKIFPSAYRRSTDKDYNSVMEQLKTGQRISLINGFIKKAKVNWAHLALAELFSKKKINRILTVNFDPLILRACSMNGEFPAVYDLATASNFIASRVAPNSVFYLNGQYSGFSILNSVKELESHKDRLRQIVEDTKRKRIWVVVGYSGGSDPLVEVLDEFAKQGDFENGLYWIDCNDVPNEAQKKLLKNKQTYYIGNQDADKFMADLAKKIDCFPPDWLTKPFDHIENIITKNIDFSTGGEVAMHVHMQLFEMLRDAKKASLSLSEKVIRFSDITDLLLEGKYANIFKQWLENGHNFSENKRKDVALAYVMWANDIVEEADKVAKTDLTKARILWARAIEGYDRAHKIDQGMAKALFNWGVALDTEAAAIVHCDKKHARELWSLSIQKYKESLRINPDDYKALSNWAGVLREEAQAISNFKPTEATKLWNMAHKKYEKALLIKPDSTAILNHWIMSLMAQISLNSKSYSLEVREKNLNKAEELLERGVELDSGFFAYNYACFWALKSDPKKSVHWLMVAEQHSKLPDRQHMDEDEDFDAIRDSQIFVDWYESEFGKPVDS